MNNGYDYYNKQLRSVDTETDKMMQLFGYVESIYKITLKLQDKIRGLEIRVNSMGKGNNDE